MTELEETAPANETNQKLRDKFRLTKDEEILKEIKPSVFAFTSNYVLGVWIILIHMVFNGNFESLLEGENVNFVFALAATLITGSGVFGFTAFMFILAWFNRMMNGSSSGKWVSSYLTLITFIPTLLIIDSVIGNDYIPLIDEYNYGLAGWVTAGFFWAFTLFYQRSFHYAITNHRVIFTQHFFVPGDGRRILFDNINEIRTQRTMMGSMIGYNTIICDTGSELGVGSDTMGITAGAASGGGGSDGSIEKMITKNLFKKFFAALSFQRTRKIDLPDPRHCFYCISKWKEIDGLLNEMHQRHSTSGVLTDLKESLAK
jgi:hypothetical protein